MNHSNSKNMPDPTIKHIADTSWIKSSNTATALQANQTPLMAIIILSLFSPLLLFSEAIASQKCSYKTNENTRVFSCKVQRNTNGTAVAVSDLNRGEIYSIGRLGGWGYAGDPNCVVNHDLQATACF